MRRSWKHSPRLVDPQSNSRSRSARTSAASSKALRRDTRTTCLSDLFPTFCSRVLQRLLQRERLPRCLRCKSENQVGRNVQLFVEVTALPDRVAKRPLELLPL